MDIGTKIRKLKGEGKKQNQSVAIALSMQRAAAKKRLQKSKKGY